MKSDAETPKSASRTVPSSARVHPGRVSLPIRRRCPEEARTVDEQVPCLDVSVDPAVLVHVDEPMQRLDERRGDHVLGEAVGEGVARDVEEGACASHKVSVCLGKDAGTE